MKKQTKINYILTLILVFCIGATIPTLIGSSQVNEQHSAKSEVPYCVTPPTVPTQVTFDGTTIDLRRYDRRERMDREMMAFTYMHSTTMLLIKRANRYFPIVEPILKANGIPDDFKYLMVIESNLNNIARSPAGAAGLWQFMPATGREFGLEVNDNVDERYNIEKQRSPPVSTSNKRMTNMATGWLYPLLTMPDRHVSLPNSTDNWQVMPWIYGWWKRHRVICSACWQSKRFSAIRNATDSC